MTAATPYPELLPSSTVHEAYGRRGALPYGIKPVSASMRVSGPAYPVQCGPGDNLALHHAIVGAAPGDVLIVSTDEALGFGYWGEVMTAAAQARGIQGLVIDGGVRDTAALAARSFPVFAPCAAIRGTGKDPTLGSAGEPIAIGDVQISKGDWVVGDADGVVVVAKDDIHRVRDGAREREQAEVEIFKRIESGESTLSIYKLPDLQSGKRRAHNRHRKAISVEGLEHGALPIPCASRVDNVIITGGVRGVDAATGAMPQGTVEQIELMYQNVEKILRAGGASLDDVCKLTVWLSDGDDRPALNAGWLMRFPDPDARPARHVQITNLGGGMKVQCEAIAVVGSTRVDR